MRFLLFSAISAVVLLPAACSSSPEATIAGTQQDAGNVLGPDSSGGDDASSSRDASGPPPSSEQEPNNATTLEDLNDIPAGGAIVGAIDPADDLDGFKTNLSAGDLYTWTLSSIGTTFAPHLGISERGNQTPTMALKGTAGVSAVQEHFVLESEQYFAFVRDARNVPSSTSAHVGGPGYRWQLTLAKTPKTPVAITFPQTVTGRLRSIGAIDIYEFTLTLPTSLDITLKGRRKNPASDIDSRISLFDKINKAWNKLTNDDDTAAQTKDSKLGGNSIPAGTWQLIVENVNPDATDLSYELAFTLR